MKRVIKHNSLEVASIVLSIFGIWLYVYATNKGYKIDDSLMDMSWMCLSAAIASLIIMKRDIFKFKK